MQSIECPWCGPRDEIEFRYGGQAGVAYPPDPAALSDEEWAGYVFVRDNPRGWFHERWFHAHGCRTWFSIRRHTVTHETEPGPALHGSGRAPSAPGAGEAG
ncbi:sarcosine oxidase subunit delta [Planomonospora venezuelensis]|uniref:Heterotetrameric sarcosine oxidase delta subunit n=1 Tax=Planomonospora venezuelensis TaxID=1999 RepID=A0A841D2U3_PLAVE|nr:sarcosine oxidase subunit delta [Planomonospora venezuelensis]MBB5964561.1 heterotetrameric sarcosine oxidase delta subunit [Planomonospora venezuelensis]GIN02858.1 sarcosine oxidase subunit delta [Planomonospora venezuelensis]